MVEGIVVGCDKTLEWILPWWWKHYRTHNNYPVAFADFGMSKKAVSWCQKHGRLLTITAPAFEERLSPKKQADWEKRFGSRVLKYRTQWFKKPLAVLASPFSCGIWLDLDCQVKGSLEPLFHTLLLGAEIALVADHNQAINTLLPGEVNYNSGVIVFRKSAPILFKWASSIEKYRHHLVGDQDVLSRIIYLTKSAVVELPDLYNWNVFKGENREAIIYHFCNEAGKLRILEELSTTHS